MRTGAVGMKDQFSSCPVPELSGDFQLCKHRSTIVIGIKSLFFREDFDYEEPIRVPWNRHHQFFRADHVALSNFECLVFWERRMSKVCVHIKERLVRGNDVLPRIVFC
jgi:hypothetical protein